MKENINIKRLRENAKSVEIAEAIANLLRSKRVGKICIEFAPYATRGVQQVADLLECWGVEGVVVTKGKYEKMLYAKVVK